MSINYHGNDSRSTERAADRTAITKSNFGAGAHSFWNAEKDLPIGIVPSVMKSWKEAVVGGYFVG